MIAVIQRVTSASVSVEGKVVSKIGKGLLILLGITTRDTLEDANYLVNKVCNLRLFPSESSHSSFDLPIHKINGEMLLVSQFTLCADLRKGRRPSFTPASPAQISKSIFDTTVELFKEKELSVQQGVFGAMMEVQLINSGPATFIVDTHELR